MHDDALEDQSSADLAVAIGVRIRQERQARGWTLDQLAAAARVSRRLVINVEQGAANPSLGSLLRISDALGVGLPTLVAPPQPRQVKVTRHGDGIALWIGKKGGRGVLVASAELPDVVGLWDWTLAPGDRHGSEAHRPGTVELLQVQYGTITVNVADETVTLGPGDAASFPGDVVHDYANPGTQPAMFSMAVFQPDLDAGLQPEPAYD